MTEPLVAVVGRPNVGKSTLVNRIVGRREAIVEEQPGVTRDRKILEADWNGRDFLVVDTGGWIATQDGIDAQVSRQAERAIAEAAVVLLVVDTTVGVTVVETDEGPIRFVDTAGMRRKSRIDAGPEYYSLVRALQSIDRADAALLVIDATEGVTHQDQRLAERIDAAGSPVVMVLNKWETLDAERRAQVMVDVGRRLEFLGYAPVLKISALTGKGVHTLVPALGQAIDAYHRRVPTGELNQVVQAAQAAQPAPAGGRVPHP